MITQDVITQSALAMGIVVGAMILVAVIYRYIRHHDFGLGGTILAVLGAGLLSPLIWQSIGLSSFKISVGPDGFTIQQEIQDIGAATADWNNRLEKLNLDISENKDRIKHLEELLPNAETNTAQQQKRLEAQKKQFEQNSQYSVLVFHKLKQTEKAKVITQSLLRAGYRSSATPTNLAESKQQLKENEAWVIYTERGKTILPQVKDILSQIDTPVRFKYAPKPSKLRRADVQILIF